MVVEPDWRHVHVDDAFHRSYRVAGWPQLPVPADWLSRLLADTHCIRTVASSWSRFRWAALRAPLIVR
jgi:hypothetical protein